MNSKVDVVWVTPNAEDVIAYCARVSNPENQRNQSYDKLIKYCVDHKHWSILEMANLCLEITCPIGIMMQITRHHFNYQIFSTRYQDIRKVSDTFYAPEIRMQDHKNRQQSVKSDDEAFTSAFSEKIDGLFNQTLSLYGEMLEAGVAKETAKFILPQAAMTRMYMNGTVRSWYHYLFVRTGEGDSGVQKEHREVAMMCKDIFLEQFPAVSKAVGW